MPPSSRPLADAPGDRDQHDEVAIQLAAGQLGQQPISLAMQLDQAVDGLDSP